MNVSFYSGLWEIFSKKSPKAAIDFMLENGFTHCEMVDIDERSFFNTPEEAKEFKGMLDAAGLGCNCYSVAINMYPDPAPAAEILKKKAELAAAVGAKYLHHTVYMPLSFSEESPDYDTLMDTVIPYVAEVVRYAAKLGVEVIFEPQGKYVNGMEGYGKFFERLKGMPGCESIGVCFDTGNVIFGNCDPYEFLQRYLPYVRNVHIKDYAYVEKVDENKKTVYLHDNGKLFESVLVGKGMMRCKECVELLEKSGYNGVYSMESNPLNYGISVNEANIYAMKFVKSLNNSTN